MILHTLVAEIRKDKIMAFNSNALNFSGGRGGGGMDVKCSVL